MEDTLANTMAATTMFPKLGYVPTSPKMAPASPPVELCDHHHVEPHQTKVEPHETHQITMEVYGDEPKDPQPTTCTFCTHLANRLDAKIQGMRRAGRHIPYGLKRDARDIRYEANNHTTRDADRHLSCPLLRNHTCDVCGEKGHTRSRCAPCGYCGEVGHIHNECPKALADDRAKGMTVVLKGVSLEMLDILRQMIVSPPTDDDVLQMLCEEYAEDVVWDEVFADL